jgi:gamma-glutamyl AIG2-like cyclotransferase
VGELWVEGDLFVVADEALEALDRLELAGPYVRSSVEVVPLGGGSTSAAVAYLASEPARWRALVAAGRADALASYPLDLAAGERLKECCVRSPGHPGPHEVVDPLAGVVQPLGRLDPDTR